MRNFRNWDIYKEGIVLVVEIYRISEALPKSELYGLTSQIRRAAVSIVNNIAEGAAKSSSKDFKRFLEMSLGSAFEVETLIRIIKDLKFIENKDLETVDNKIGVLQKRINVFIQKLREEG